MLLLHWWRCGTGGHSGNPKISGRVFQVLEISSFENCYLKFVRNIGNPIFRVPENSGLDSDNPELPDRQERRLHRQGMGVGGAVGAGALTAWRGDRQWRGCQRRGSGGSVHGVAAPTSPAGAEPGRRGPRRRRGDRRRQLHWRRRRATVSTSLVAGGSASGGGASGGEGVRQSGGGAQMLLCSRPAWSAEARVRTLQWAGWQGKGLGGLG